MRILLLNHGAAAQWGGGDGVQIAETARQLRLRGHQVEELNSDAPDVAGFDLVHIFNCRFQSSFAAQMQACTRAGIPVVVSPIWLSIARAVWGSRGVHGVLTKAVREGSKSVVSHLLMMKQRTLKVNWDESIVHYDGHGYSKAERLAAVGQLLTNANALLPNSWLELQAVRTDLFWTGNLFDVAHIGVDPSMFLSPDPNRFLEYFDLRKSFVLQAGRIEPGKNQAMLCWALRQTDLQIVLIGSSANWPSYAQLCREISGDRLTIIDHIPQEMLASAYAAAGVHVLPSWMETCGLVSLEAACSGTPVVGSTFGHELEYLQRDAWYCDPADPDSIRTAVISALQAGRDSDRPLGLKERVLGQFTWEMLAIRTERLYQEVLEKI
ncbi:glycosyltransferase family 4 protein [Synechococcus sp. CS-205]|uniref:glycosyltransferase family 4 protein n=1 Tax=Synechococcus sp. CS-205 TaxID=2847984 RepID=UPI00223BABE1|nr:glycosyltransferase family 4 protein [Synechococcus sp. CS-205]MCT0248671.1 glycosyltransferase family 4 protein [Synechococcus sp. CS-205]